MTAPTTTVINIDSSSYYDSNTNEWRIDSSQTISGDEVFFERYVSGVLASGNNGFSLKLVNGSTYLRANAGDNNNTPYQFKNQNNVWTDELLIANGETVYALSNNGSTVVFELTVSPSMLWTASGGGTTNSEGLSNPSGSFYFNSQSQLVFVVNSTSPSSDGNIVYKIFRRTVNQVMGHAYTVTHSNGSPTEFSIGLDLSLYDRWELRVESSTALVDSATMSVYSTAPKKVFCNFW